MPLAELENAAFLFIRRGICHNYGMVKHSQMHFLAMLFDMTAVEFINQIG